MHYMRSCLAGLLAIGWAEAGYCLDVRPNPYGQGTGTWVHTAMEGTRFVGDPQAVISDDTYDERALDQLGKSLSSIRYPVDGSLAPGGYTSEGAGADSHAMADVNLPAGQLRAYASGWLHSGSQSATYAWTQGYARACINDVITLDQPAQVTFVGHVDGTLHGAYSGNASRPSGSLRAEFGFWQFCGGEVGWELAGYSQELRVDFADVTNTGTIGGLPTSPPIYEPVTFSIDLPAGSHRFSAYLDASFSMSTAPGGSALALLAFDNTAMFQLHVPEGVTATSASGFLPINVPEPSCLIWMAAALVLWRRRPVS